MLTWSPLRAAWITSAGRNSPLAASAAASRSLRPSRAAEVESRVNARPLCQLCGALTGQSGAGQRPTRVALGERATSVDDSPNYTHQHGTTPTTPRRFAHRPTARSPGTTRPT